MSGGTPVSLTPAERARIDHIDRLFALGDGAVGALIDALSDRSWTVRRAAVAALAALGDDAARPLCSWLFEQRTSEHAIAAAVDALSTSIGATATAEVMAHAARGAGPPLEDMARILGRRRAFDAVPLLRVLLANANDNIAVAAIEALGAIGGTASVDALVAAIRSRNFFRTFPAMQVAARTGDPRVIEPLAELLADDGYRFEAARALGRTATPLAIEPLAALLDRGGPAMAPLVAAALDELYARAAWTGAADHILQTLRLRLAGASGRFAAGLGGADPDERLAIVRVLGLVGDAGTLAVLAPLLDDPELRAAATEALQRLVRSDDSALIAALASPATETRAAVLAAVSSARAAPAVRQLLDDDDPEVRARACDALARIGDTSAVTALFARLADPSARVGHAAAAAIQSLGTATTPGLAIAALGARDPNLRRHALRIIAYLGCNDAFDAVRAAIDDGDGRIAELAVAALTTLGDPRVDDILIDAARAPREIQRIAAMRAAGHRGGDRMASVLERGLDDPAPWVRYYACQGLGRIARVSATPGLIARLADATPHVRIAAIEAIARLDTPEAWDRLLALARSPDLEEQRAALIGIGHHAQPAAVAVLLDATTAADVATRLIALSGLARSTDPRALAALATAARDPTPEIRDAALSLLGEHPGEAAAQLVLDIALASEPGDPVHATLSRGGPIRIAAITGRLAAARDGEVAILIAALARMQSPAALRALFEALRSPNPAVRRDTATALVAIGATGAVAAVERMAADDRDPEVRRACAAAVTA